MVRIDGTCFVLAGIYLTRFVRSPAGREAGILVEPATAHRLVAAAVFLGAKFGGHPPRRWTAVFEASSEGAIRAGEMPELEGRFLRAIGFRLFVDSDGFDGFCKDASRRCPRWRRRRPASVSGACLQGSQTILIVLVLAKLFEALLAAFHCSAVYLSAGVRCCE